MKVANVDGRATLLVDELVGVDVHATSGGRYGPDLESLYTDWSSFSEWATSVDLSSARRIAIERSELGAPSPSPRQVFAIGLNYDSHAAESGFDAPTDLPPVFTKFVSSITGPDTTVTLPEGGNTDWEVELVVVIGRVTSSIAPSDAWNHVAGLTVGQDISERITQLRGPAPQFGLGKSFGGFAPTGPWLVTVDEFDNPDDLELGCAIDSETVQSGRTRDLIFSVPKLIAGLSETVVLYPGDLIFTGTPAGVGVGRKPQRFLQDGENLRSWVEGIGELNQHFAEATPR